LTGCIQLPLLMQRDGRLEFCTTRHALSLAIGR
jgi:hypothetical protein